MLPILPNNRPHPQLQVRLLGFIGVKLVKEEAGTFWGVLPASSLACMPDFLRPAYETFLETGGAQKYEENGKLF